MKKKIPGRIKGVRPVLSQILVEQLTAQEASGSRLALNENADMGAPQAYILDMGPALETANLGFKIGSRVVIQGHYIPMPKPPGQDRVLGIIEAHNVKAVIEEEDE